MTVRISALSLLLFFGCTNEKLSSKDLPSIDATEEAGKLADSDPQRPPIVSPTTIPDDPSDFLPLPPMPPEIPFPVGVVPYPGWSYPILGGGGNGGGDRSRCGDGVLNSKEACDNGANNSDTLPNACRTTCELPSCGDNVIDLGETCDNGNNNSDTAPNACRTTCVLASCGDNVVDLNEECDNGPNNSDSAPNACRTICVLAFCGDSVVDLNEECDNGPNNSDTVPNACRTTCDLASCGDGVLDAGEECDDDNTTSGDGCSASCEDEECPDGQTGDICSQMQPLCLDTPFIYPATVNGPSAEPGNAYGCLNTQPNPEWFYLKVETTGNIAITATALFDIDFIIYGPFDDLATAIGTCGSQGTIGNPPSIDCSYSVLGTETINIPMATAGQIYVLLITNFSNNAQNITLVQEGGPGGLGCCQMLQDVNTNDEEEKK